MGFQGTIGPSGSLTLTKIPGIQSDKYGQLLKHSLPIPFRPLFKYKLRNFPNIWRGLWKISFAKLFRIPTHYGVLRLLKVDGKTGEYTDFGIVSLRVVTTVGVNYIVDAFQNLTEPENMKFHGFGTGTTAEAVGDTALVTELTTQYNPDNTRPTGSLTEGASANIFRTVGTVTPDSGGTIAVTEHGIFSATSAGTLLDRSVFTAVNLNSANGDSLQATYDLTLTAGS